MLESIHSKRGLGLRTLETGDYHSFARLREEFIRNNLAQTLQEMSMQYSTVLHTLSERQAIQTARYYLIGVFVGQYAIKKFVDCVNSSRTPESLLKTSDLPITFGLTNSKDGWIGLSNPFFNLKGIEIGVFGLSPENYSYFFHSLTQDDIAQMRVKRVEISLNLRAIINYVKKTTFKNHQLFEDDMTLTGAHEVGHALQYLSANQSLRKRNQLTQDFKQYPPLSKIALDDPEIFRKYTQNNSEIQANRWETFFAKHYL